MKKILINEENKDKIQKAIDDIQSGREKERLLEFEDILRAVELAQAKEKKLLKKYLKGFRLLYSLNQKMPSSYNYKYSADVCEIEWGNKGWYLISISRGSFFPSQNDTTKFYWSSIDESLLK